MRSHSSLSAALGSATEFRSKVAKSAILALFLPFLIFFIGGQAVTAPSASAVVSNCTSSQFTITAKHNTVFYFDNGTSITSGYAEYQIVNKGTSRAYWAKLENFSGGALALARFETATRSLGTMSTNDSTNQYWYLTASAISSSTQAHDVVIYSSDPSSGGGTAVCKLTRGFNSTASTIAASANKLTSVEYSAFGAPGSSTFTATVKGQTGTIGKGPTNASDVNLNPATHADFAASNYRLSDVSYQCTGGAATTGALYIPNACEGNYTAIFTFIYLSDTYASGVVKAVSPIMQIASGTQMKHTSTPTFTIAVAGTVSTPQITTANASGVTTSAATLNGTIDSGTFSSISFCYSTTDPGSHFVSATCSPVSATSGSPYNYLGISSLNSVTTYYFEFIGVSGGTTYYGGVKTFTTLNASIIDTTTAASAITTNAATLNGVVSGIATGAISNAYFIITRTSPGSLTGDPARNVQLDPAISETITVTVVASLTFDASATSLTENTTYYYELVVVDNTGASYFGGVKTFTTTAAVTYTITFNPNGGVLDSGNTVDTATVTSGDNALTFKPNPNPERSDHEFLGWGTSSGSTTVLTSYTVSGAATLYAIWRSTAPATAPVYVPRPPTITNISAPEVCAVGSQLTLTGTYLAGASATVDGVSAQVLSSSYGSMLISLPARSIGTKTIVVTNIDGTASTTVKYKFVDSPIYVNYIYPETFKDRDFSYTFTATNAEKYAIVGKMPAGLTLNPLTGEISGAPTVEGDFVFTIVASNYCDETHLIVYMFVDKAIPNTFTCSVAFNVPKSDNISDIKLSQLKTCLGKITTLSPKYIDPIIYLSGGIPDGLTTFQALTHPRYIRVIDFIKSIGLDYQIYVGAFGGTAESIQINVYWPTT